MRYRFDSFEIDTDNFVLLKNGKVQHVEPRVFDFLSLLSSSPQKVISREELVDALWDGRVISDTSISSCVKAARKALGDSGDRQAYIRTVRGRGFQFVGTITADGEDPAPNAESPPARPATDNKQSPLPSLIVLPFETFGDAPELGPIADGLVENLTTVLTRVPLLSVASRSTAFSLKGRTVGASYVYKELKLSHMLEGSVQKLGDTVRLNIQLIETTNGFHLWAQNFDAPLDDHTTTALLHAVLPKLEAQLNRAIFTYCRQDDGELTGRQLVLQAMSLLATKGWHRASFNGAADLLRRAVILEPGLALAHAYLALILALGHRVGLLRETDAIIHAAEEEAERALDLDNLDSNVLGMAGCALADVGQTDRAIPIIRNAIDLNPYNSQAWSALGAAYLMDGRADEAVTALEQGIKISPLDGRLAVWTGVLCLAYMKTGDLDKALVAARDACQASARSYLPRVALTAVYLVRGDIEAATRALEDCYRVKPDLSNQEIEALIGEEIAEQFRALKRKALKTTRSLL